MRKSAVILSAILGLVWLSACKQKDNSSGVNGDLQNQVDSLKSALDNTYKPGFGEFMLSVQVHHIKLWFAGKAHNWKLANFELKETQEALTAIKTYCQDRKETQSLDMIDAPLQQLSQAVKQQDDAAFTEAYEGLTETCNSCHQSTNHGFNVVQIPTSNPYTDQQFSIEK